MVYDFSLPVVLETLVSKPDSSPAQHPPYREAPGLVVCGPRSHGHPLAFPGRADQADGTPLANRAASTVASGLLVSLTKYDLLGGMRLHAHKLTRCC